MGVVVVVLEFLFEVLELLRPFGLLRLLELLELLVVDNGDRWLLKLFLLLFHLSCLNVRTCSLVN